MRFPLIGASYTNRSPAASSEQTMNLYPEVIESGQGKSQVVLHGTPGLTEWYDMVNTSGTAGRCRGLYYAQNDPTGAAILGVWDDDVRLIRQNPDGTAAVTLVTPANSITNDGARCWIAFNGTQYLLIDGTLGWTISGSTITQITDADFPAEVDQGVYLDGYFIVKEKNTQKFYISALLDGTSWAALDFSSADSKPDDIGAMLPIRGELWLLGKDRSEIWYNSGNSDFPFERIQGALIDVGIDAPDSVAQVGDSLMWLGSNYRGKGSVYRSQGYQAERVSTHAVEYAISQMTTTSDAYAFSYYQEGHNFYVLSFPTAKETWCYDLATGLWHERSYRNVSNDEHILPNFCVHAYGSKYICGSRVDTKLLEFDLDAYTDNGDAIRRVRRSAPVHEENRVLFHHSLVIDHEPGVGLVSGQGSDPQMMIRWSNDGGQTWSNEHTRSMGKIGEYKERIRMNRLGRARSRVYELAVTDPVKVGLLDGFVEYSVGAN